MPWIHVSGGSSDCDAGASSGGLRRRRGQRRLEGVVDPLDHAAEVLVTVFNELLHAVGSRAIPPEAYHVM